MPKPIPPSKWIWCGYPGHFCAAENCQLHLHTRVGDYRISTVGDYHPSDSEEMKEVGCGRYFETFVYRVSGNGTHGEGRVTEWANIDARGYGKGAVTGEAERGHMEMCRRYARVAVGLEPEGWQGEGD